MPKCSLTWYKSKSKRIMRDVKALKRQDIATEINESHQTISYRIKNVYPDQLDDWVRILNMAGYEIVEKGE